MSILPSHSLAFPAVSTNSLSTPSNSLIGNLWISNIKEMIQINTLFHELIQTTPKKQLPLTSLKQFLEVIVLNKKSINEYTSKIFDFYQVLANANLFLRYYQVVNHSIELIEGRFADELINSVVNLPPILSIDIPSNGYEAHQAVLDQSNPTVSSSNSSVNSSPFPLNEITNDESVKVDDASKYFN